MSPLSVKATAIAAIAAFVAGAAAGWTANGWRLGEQVAELRGRVDTQEQSIAALKGANARCTAGVADVQAAVKGYVAEGLRRSKAAQEAMARAEKDAAQHLAAARGALNRPMPARGQECNDVAVEASAYARKRKGAP